MLLPLFLLHITRTTQTSSFTKRRELEWNVGGMPKPPHLHNCLTKKDPHASMWVNHKKYRTLHSGKGLVFVIYDWLTTSLFFRLSTKTGNVLEKIEYFCLCLLSWMRNTDHQSFDCDNIYSTPVWKKGPLVQIWFSTSVLTESWIILMASISFLLSF